MEKSLSFGPKVINMLGGATNSNEVKVEIETMAYLQPVDYNSAAVTL